MRMFYVHLLLPSEPAPGETTKTAFSMSLERETVHFESALGHT
jgi:hypothetical protein